MNSCRWMKRVEACFDGAPADPAVERHTAACPVCAAHLEALRRMRAGVAAVAVRESVTDAQFPAFMRGIREGIERPERHHTGFWAVLSLTAAALIVAVATFAVFSGGTAPVRATEVESMSTDLQGAKVDTYRSEEGVTTVWITMSKDDVE